jgi:hypothetical protein
MSKLSERIRPGVEAAPWVCEEVSSLEKRLAEAEETLDDVYRHCQCHSADQKGFDYGEHHPLMGRAPSGKRWLKPREIIDVYRTKKSREALKGVVESEKGGDK